MARGRPSLKPRTAFGQRLRAAREAAGLSQAAVAAKLGLKQAAYANLERYRTAIRPDQIEKVALILKVPVKDLFERSPRNFYACGPVGRARRAFEALSQLSRHKQADVLDVVEPFLVRHARRRPETPDRSPSQRTGSPPRVRGEDPTLQMNPKRIGY